MSILEEDFRELSQRLSPELSQLNAKSILLVGATGAISSYLGRFLINVLRTKVASFQLALTARSEDSLKNIIQKSINLSLNVFF